MVTGSPSLITNNLVLGDAFLEHDLQKLQLSGVTHILQVRCSFDARVNTQSLGLVESVSCCYMGDKTTASLSEFLPLLDRGLRRRI